MAATASPGGRLRRFIVTLDVVSSSAPEEPVLTCEVATDLAELVSVLLFEHGALAVGEEPAGDTVLLRAGFSTEAEARGAAEAIRSWTVAAVDMVAPTWQDEQRVGLAPVLAGEWFVTTPESDDPAPPDTTHLRIDPGRAFGHGAHPSTRLLLELLPAAVSPSDRVIDVGTGTGVLALAAASCGAAVLAVDVDPVAVECARSNVDRNGTSGSVQVALVDGGSMPVVENHDLAFVNVTIDQHRRIAPSLVHVSDVLVSGLLEHQFEEACSLYDRRVKATRRDDGWVAAWLSAGATDGG